MNISAKINLMQLILFRVYLNQTKQQTNLASSQFENFQVLPEKCIVHGTQVWAGTFKSVYVYDF